MQKDTYNKLSTMTVLLHWFVGFGIIALMAVGIYMEETEAFALYPIHKSIGILMLGVILYRVIWRILNGWPKPVSNYKQIEKFMSATVHWVLILGTILFPLSGMIMSHAGGYGLAVFGYEVAAMNFDPTDTTKIMANNETVAQIANTVHSVLAKVMMLAIMLHIAGALKHHIFDMDGTFKRMKGNKID
jgi:cytochrome b561